MSSNSIFFEEVSPYQDDEENDEFSYQNDAVNERVTTFPGKSQAVLRTDLLQRLQSGPLDHINELDAAADLLDLVQEELIKFGTDGLQQLDDHDITLVIKALRCILRRLGTAFALPFSNFTSFKDYWVAHDMAGDGGWQKRRFCVNKLIEVPRGYVDELIQNRLTKPLANPALQSTVSWPQVDEEVAELRRKFEMAATPQDFRALGTNCVGVLEAVAESVFEPQKHLTTEDDPSNFVRDRFKQRLERYIKIEMVGADEELIKVTLATIRLVHRVKHRITNQLMAGVAADSVIMLVSIIRRIADPTVERVLNDNIPF